jgi:hypothetical protein
VPGESSLLPSSLINAKICANTTGHPQVVAGINYKIYFTADCPAQEVVTTLEATIFIPLYSQGEGPTRMFMPAPSEALGRALSG